MYVYNLHAPVHLDLCEKTDCHIWSEVPQNSAEQKIIEWHYWCLLILN